MATNDPNLEVTTMHEVQGFLHVLYLGSAAATRELSFNPEIPESMKQLVHSLVPRATYKCLPIGLLDDVIDEGPQLREALRAFYKKHEDDTNIHRAEFYTLRQLVDHLMFVAEATEAEYLRRAAEHSELVRRAEAAESALETAQQPLDAQMRRLNASLIMANQTALVLNKQNGDLQAEVAKLKTELAKHTPPPKPLPAPKAPKTQSKPSET